MTHDKRFKNVEKDLSLFDETMAPLKDKVLALLILLPQSYELNEGLEDLRGYDHFFDDAFGYPIEVRHSS